MKKILIIEDEASIRETISDILEIEGYTASVAYSGDEANAQLRSAQFRAVICDYRMPGLNGGEVLAVIRNELALHDLLFVIITSTSGELPIVRTEFTRIFKKPLHMESLLDLLTGYFSDRSA